MKKMFRKILFPGTLTLLFLAGCQKNIDKLPSTFNEVTKSLHPPKELKDFVQVNLVGDNNDFNPTRIDNSLINAWGIAFSPLETVWVSSMGAGFGEVYKADGSDALPHVTIPSPIAETGGHPTGVAFYGGAGF